MANNKNDLARQYELERQKSLAGLQGLFQEWKEQGHEFDEEIEIEQAVARREVPPPPPPEITKYNPDGIVDIVTFCEHPYYLGQRLYPWQKLILKLFYMGTEGNTHLKVEDERPDDPTSCEGCVWQYIRKDEEKVWKARQDGKKIKPIMSLANSPCVGCSRLPQATREGRIQMTIDDARKLSEEKEAEKLREHEPVDKFETERDLMMDREFDQECRKQVDAKRGEKFSELVLVLGRRSGKSYMVSVIALYEVYRLISMGHPQFRYNLLEFDEIFIVNVAVSEKQAKDAIFAKIKSMALSSPYFDTCRDGEPLELEMRFFTPHDLAENANRKERGAPLQKGSIVVRCGHSNAAGLVGLTTWAVIIDELAAMAGDNAGSGLDYRLYDDMKPATATFDEDGKVICLSNPKGPVGLLYELYSERMSDETTLIFRLPTWQTNPNINKKWLAAEQKKDPQSYPMQYGAEFGSTSESPFLPDHVIPLAFGGDKRAREDVGIPMVRYFCHVDPAKNNDYYTLAVVHTEPIPGEVGPDLRPARMVVVDHIMFWVPMAKNQPVKAEIVEDYILQLHEKFKFAQVSYDQWNSMSSIIKLQSHGINCVERVFNKQYKDMIYGELYDLFMRERISFYNINTEYTNEKGEWVLLNDVEEARTQFTFLQKKWNGKRYSIEALAGYKDDIPDCIAAAAHEAYVDKVFARLPSVTSVRLGGRFGR